MGYSVTADNHKEHFNIQLNNTRGCTYCKDGIQLLDTTGDNRWYISDSKNEIHSGNDESLQTIKINYCPMCGKKLT